MNDSTLSKSLEKFDIDLPPEQIELISRYCQLLWEWNTKLNLTRHTDFDQFVSRDVLDSLQLAKELKAGEHVLDVGTGGGVPGILLAILRPEVHVSLCDSVGKKARAVAEIVAELDLDVPVIQARVEDALVDMSFDTLVARAVGPMWKMLSWLKPHWSSIGRLLIVKGPKWIEERGKARHRGMLKGLELRRVATYAMPDRDGESVILMVWPKAAAAG